MWLGEQITENGIGNGISIIIFAGIVAAIPTGIGQIYQTQFADAGDALFLNILKVLIILIVVIALIAGVIFVQQGVRKIPVQYAKRVVGRKMFGGQSTHIPLKVNAAGVIPVIFALSLLVFPPTIASFWRGNGVAEWIITNLSHTAPLGMVLYVLLIIGFTYFYTFVQFNPVQMAEQMKKERRIHSRHSPGEKHGSVLYPSDDSNHPFRCVVLGRGIDYSDDFRRNRRFAAVGSNWRYFLTYRSRCRFGNDENHRKPIDQTPLQRLH